MPSPLRRSIMREAEVTSCCFLIALGDAKGHCARKISGMMTDCLMPCEGTVTEFDTVHSSVQLSSFVAHLGTRTRTDEVRRQSSQVYI